MFAIILMIINHIQFWTTVIKNAIYLNIAWMGSWDLSFGVLYVILIEYSGTSHSSLPVTWLVWAMF